MSSIVVTRAQVSAGSSLVVTKAGVAVAQPAGSSVVVSRAAVSVLQPVGSSLFVTRALVAVAPNLVANPGGAKANLRAGTVRPLAVQAANQGVIAFEWTQVSGPAVTIVDGDKANASYVAPPLITPASVGLQLRVGDGQNWSSPAQVTDTIAAHPSWQIIGGALTAVVSKGYVKPGDPPPVPPSLVAGSVPLGATNYPIPAGAVYVSPTGSDTAAGTIGAPYQTIGKAVASVPDNSTIVVRAGVYHESVTHSRLNLTIQAYPGEVVWWDGAVPVTGWAQNGSTWNASWVTTTDRSPTYSAGATDGTNPGFGFINLAYPYASWPDQVWINGVYLRQVGTLADVGPGKFFVEGVASGTNSMTFNSTRLHIGDNPAGKLVEASNLGTALLSVGQYQKVLGMGFRRYNPPQPNIAAVRLAREFALIENCIIQECASGGLSFIRPDCTANQVTVTDSGMVNIHANQADRLVLNRVKSLRANRENFNMSPSAGGMKVTRLRTVTVSNSIFADNNCTGVWFDESVYDATVVSCDIQNNAKHGILDELGGKALFVDNLITGNAAIGVYTFNTDDVHVWNNTIVGNGEANVDVNADTRAPMTASSVGRDPRQAFPDPTMTWVCDNLEVKNNVIGKMPSNKWALRIRDSHTSGQRAAATFGPDIDGNFYNWLSASNPWGWSQANAANQPIATFAAFKVNTAQEAHGVATVGSDQLNADFTLKASALTATAAAPRPLPADVAAAAGQATGATHMGAWR